MIVGKLQVAPVSVEFTLVPEVIGKCLTIPVGKAGSRKQLLVMTITLQLLADLFAYAACIRSYRQELEEIRRLFVSLAGESIETGIIALVAVSRHLLAGLGCIIRR